MSTRMIKTAAAATAMLAGLGTALATGGATALAAPAAPDLPVTALAYGETAHLPDFDVTALQHTRGADGVSQGWKVRVCSTGTDSAGPDGLTRVSTDPWQVWMRDGESAGAWEAHPVGSLPADPGWSPAYGETRLGVGQCQEGWIAVKDGNPDTQTGGLQYALSDGSRASWH